MQAKPGSVPRGAPQHSRQLWPCPDRRSPQLQPGTPRPLSHSHIQVPVTLSHDRHTTKARLSCSKQQNGQQRIKGNPVPSGALQNNDRVNCHLILADPCCCSSRKLRRPHYKVTKSGGAPFYVGWCRWINGCPTAQTHLFYVS